MLLRGNRFAKNVDGRHAAHSARRSARHRAGTAHSGHDVRHPPRPDAGPATPPRSGKVYQVRYLDRQGVTVSTVYRKRWAAERFAAQIRARGGTPTTWVATVDQWADLATATKGKSDGALHRREQKSG
jgi:hypothetical protein